MSGAIETYLALTPIAYPYLRHLAIVEEDGVSGPEIRVEMRFGGDGMESLIVRCSGIRDLTFRQPFTTDMKLHSLDVRDISSAQLEGINFEVRDLEEEWLGFQSRTFEAAPG